MESPMSALHMVRGKAVIVNFLIQECLLDLVLLFHYNTKSCKLPLFNFTREKKRGW